jgi:hypothetical protein
VFFSIINYDCTGFEMYSKFNLPGICKFGPVFRNRVVKIDLDSCEVENFETLK